MKIRKQLGKVIMKSFWTHTLHVIRIVKADEVSVKHSLIDQGTFKESRAEVWYNEVWYIRWDVERLLRHQHYCKKWLNSADAAGISMITDMINKIVEGIIQVE